MVLRRKLAVYLGLLEGRVSIVNYLTEDCATMIRLTIRVHTFDSAGPRIHDFDSGVGMRLISGEIPHLVKTILARPVYKTARFQFAH